jgi:hypothetical protein
MRFCVFDIVVYGTFEKFLPIENVLKWCFLYIYFLLFNISTLKPFKNTKKKKPFWKVEAIAKKEKKNQLYQRKWIEGNKGFY